MILCVSPNSAVDVSYRVPHVQLGASHRVLDIVRRGGGKTVNVARVLHALGHEVQLLSFRGGHAGRFLSDDVEHGGVTATWIDVDAETRTSVAVLDANGATLFNEAGAALSAMEWAAFAAAADRLCPNGGVLVASGSLPAAAPEDGFAQLVRIAAAHGSSSVIDTYGPWMASALQARPTVAKLNRDEAADLLGSPVLTMADAAEAARRLCAAGAQHCVLTLGAEGAIVSDGVRVVRAWSDRTVAGNPTGAGDSMTAGLAAALEAGHAPLEAITEPLALGAATVAAPVAGDFDRTEYEAQLHAIHVEEI